MSCLSFSTMENPYRAEETAPPQSSYLCPDPDRQSRLIDARTGQKSDDQLAVHVHNMFRAMITGPAFPCILGRSAFNSNAYRFGLYSSLLEETSVYALCHDICEFVFEQPNLPGDFS